MKSHDKEIKYCNWQWDSMYDSYHTDCGKFIHAIKIKEHIDNNRFKFCPYCGAIIKESEY